MKSVFVVGGVSFDMVIYLERLPAAEPQTVFSRGGVETVGSTGAGKAFNLNRLGFDVTLHAMLGADARGEAVRGAFEAEKLCFLYDIDPLGTERHINLMDEGGGRVSIYVDYATFEPVVDLARLEPVITASDVIALNINNYCRTLIPLIKKYGKPIWCDIHDYDGKNPYHQDFIAAADYLFMSGDAMPEYRAFMQKMVERGKGLVVCTQGKHGATALIPDGTWIETPALDYPFKDANGAGDSFFAGVLYGYLSGYAPEKSLRMGAIVGGLCVTVNTLFDPELSTAKVESEYRRHFGD